jgi:hypothetical protein
MAQRTIIDVISAALARQSPLQAITLLSGLMVHITREHGVNVSEVHGFIDARFEEYAEKVGPGLQ